MLSVCACRRSQWSPGLPSCLERVPSYLLFSSPSSSPTTTDWPTSRPAPPASPAAPPRLTLRTPALWPRPPVTRRTSSHSYRTAACDWQLARPITAQKLELCLLVPPPFRINGYQLLFLFFTFLQVQTVEWRGVAFGGDHTDELYSLWCSQVVCLTTDGCCVAFTCSLEGVTAWVGKSFFKLCCVHVHLVGISAFYLSERLNRLLTAVSCIWMTTKRAKITDHVVSELLPRLERAFTSIRSYSNYFTARERTNDIFHRTRVWSVQSCSGFVMTDCLI